MAEYTMKKIVPALLLFLSCFLFSCGKSPPERIDLSDDFFYLPMGEHSTVYDAQNDYVAFKKFEMQRQHNISKIIGTDGQFVWLRAEFFIPENLKNEDLGLFIAYLHFADEVYINGNFAGKYGSFPPKEKSSLFVSHFYHFPKNLLNQIGKNTILIKVWSHGRSHISDNVFVGEYADAQNASGNSSFMTSKFYLIFEGIMFCTVILYLLMFFWQRNQKSYLSFALMNVATIFFLVPFFAPEFSWYNSSDLHYTTFIKFFMCISFYFLTFFISKFVFNYFYIESHGEREKPWEMKAVKIIRVSLLTIQTGLTLFAPNYDFLIKICPTVLVLVGMQLGIPVFFLFRWSLSRKMREKAFPLVAGFAPTLFFGVVDVAVRLLSSNYYGTYLTVYGFQLTILVFIFILTIKFNKALVRNDYLTENLKSEVSKRTKELSEINGKLSAEIRRSDTELEMASIVQQKFFPFPNLNFKGWDIAVCYNPVMKVSGDLYDYYHDGSKLDGFSLFDVSGHGISASLITMLSKGIIYNEFKRAKEKFRLLSDALIRINDQIIDAKGEIENYLTGLLFRFSEFDPNDVCRVEMSNAGHPNPIFYSAKDNSVSEIRRDETQEQYGAIGIKGIPVCFPNLIFFMGVGDVLVFFTDGLNESTNNHNEEFGKERIMEVLKRSGPKDAQTILEELIDSLYLFMNGAKRKDDLSIIVLKRTNSKGYIDYIEDFAKLEEV